MYPYTNYCTIRQAAKHTGVAECYIRKLVKEGKCPGFYSGARFNVNVEKLLKTLDN